MKKDPVQKTVNALYKKWKRKLKKKNTTMSDVEELDRLEIQMMFLGFAIFQDESGNPILMPVDVMYDVAPTIH